MSRNQREGRYSGKQCKGYKYPSFDTLPKRHARTGTDIQNMWTALKPHHWPKERAST